jgi:hypothetical protein
MPSKRYMALPLNDVWKSFRDALKEALAELSENKTGPWPALSRSKIFFIPILLRAKPKCPIDQPSTY